MEITTERIEPGTERMKVQIDYPDYEADFKLELKKAAQQSNYKGFRKGKVPAGFVLRTQGQSLLYNLIFKKINQLMGEHLEQSGIEYLFDPLPVEDQTTYDFNPTKKENFTFLFDLCLPPELSTLIGWGTENAYRDYQLDVTDEEINAKVIEFKKSHGELVDVEIVSAADEANIKFELSIPACEGFSAVELNIGFLWNELTADFQAKLDGAKPGDEFVGSMMSFIVEDSHHHIEEQYFFSLKMDDDYDGSIEEKLIMIDLKWIIEEVSVFREAEIDDEFLKKVSGGGELIKDEEEFRGKIAEMIASEYIGISRSIILKRLRDRVTEKNELEIPEKFVREFVLSGDEEKEMTDELKKSVMWSIFSTSLAKQKGIQVTEEEVKSFLANQVINWMRGMQDQQLIMSMVDRLMQDKAATDNATENIFLSKLAGVVYEEVEKEVIKLDKKNFDQLIEEEFPQSEPNGDEEE